MKKDPKIFLSHIIESINLVEEYSHNKNLQDFMGSNPLQDMIIRGIEIIGEAVKHLPQETKDAHPEVPWKSIAGMRGHIDSSVFRSGYRVHMGCCDKGPARTQAKVIEDPG